MKRDWLGDSYDAVKRMWADLLHADAPLYAEERYVPESIRTDYTKITRIPFLKTRMSGTYSIMNDPDTGIRLPEGTDQSEGRKHIRIETIVRQLEMPDVFCVVTFDQSNYRSSPLDITAQLERKIEVFYQHNRPALYYLSHAPFAFTCKTLADLTKLGTLMGDFGIPIERVLERRIG